MNLFVWVSFFESYLEWMNHSLLLLSALVQSGTLLVAVNGPVFLVCSINPSQCPIQHQYLWTNDVRWDLLESNVLSMCSTSDEFDQEENILTCSGSLHWYQRLGWKNHVFQFGSKWHINWHMTLFLTRFVPTTKRLDESRAKRTYVSVSALSTLSHRYCYF